MPEDPSPRPGEGPLRPVLQALVLGALALAALSLLAPSAPTYDPYAWIIWGREILHLDLVTTEGPSWKPLPVLFTTVFAIFGTAAPALWLVVARAGSLVAIGLAYLLGRTLGAGRWGAGLAALALAVAHAWTFNAWLGNSEGLLVACLMGASLAHLRGHPRAAFALAVCAGLLRPEAWPFLGLYGLWLLWRRRVRLRFVFAGLALLPVLWLGPEWWGSGDLWRASSRARTDLPPGSPGASPHPAASVLHEYAHLVPIGGWVALALTIVAVAVGRRRPRWRSPVAALAALTVAWIGLVAVMAGQGYSGNQRYVIPPLAMTLVLAGVGAGWLLRRVPAGAPRAVLGIAAGIGLALPGVLATADNGHELMDQSRLPGALSRAVADAGGAARLRACGPIFTEALLVPQVAWQLHLHLNELTYLPVRGSALVIRAKVDPHLPKAPPLGVFAGLPQRTLSVAHRWRILVVGRCAR